jgi:hypothetical protein
VRADDHVDLARRQPPGHLSRLRRGEEARQHLHAHRIAREAIGERLVVLLREQRRRDEDRHLLAVLHGLERRADGDLRLPEAHVAAHEAVHRVALLHVALDLGDGDELIGRLLVREGVLELVLPGRVVGERVPRLVQPLLVQHDELLGDLAHR